MRKNMINLLVRVIVVSVLISMVSCQSKEQELPPDEITVRLKWVHQAQFAGVYVAAEKGFYQEENLKVEIIPFSFEEPVLEDVISGNSLFGIKSASEIIQARSDGLPVKAFAVIYKISPLCLYSLKESGITSPQDFVGKKVGLKPGQIMLSYQVMMEKLGIDTNDVTEVQVKEYGADDLINGFADVSTGFSINEPQLAIESGYDVNIMLFADYGVSVYDDVLFATDDTLNNQPELVERFLRATLEGWKYAIQNEEETVEIIMNYAIDSTKSHQTYMLHQSIPLIHTGESPIGWMERDKWEKTHEVLLNANVIKKPVDFDEAYTMTFLNEIYGLVE